MITAAGYYSKWPGEALTVQVDGTERRLVVLSY